MVNLWRTQRPRFPLYQSDGLGRDYYIKYTNGGFWENQFVISKKPDYVRNKYNNFHSLFHMAAPFKYWGDGSGREHYILKCNGLYHDQKPLCSYTLTDFLRNGKNIQGTPDMSRKKIYFSLSEIKYNQQLRNLEKKLVKRLYTDPLQKKKKKIMIDIDNGNKDKYGNPMPLKNFGFQTCSQFNTNNNNIKFNTLDGNLNSREHSLENKNKMKHAKTLENEILLPKSKNTLQFNGFKTYENTFNLNTGSHINKKKIRKIKFENNKNNAHELNKDNNDEIEFKKAVVGGKLVNKRIKIV
jgi:hypothetical protein